MFGFIIMIVWLSFQVFRNMDNVKQALKIAVIYSRAESGSFLRTGYLIPSGPGAPFFDLARAARTSSGTMVLAKFASSSGSLEFVAVPVPGFLLPTPGIFGGSYLKASSFSDNFSVRDSTAHLNL